MKILFKQVRRKPIAIEICEQDKLEELQTLLNDYIEIGKVFDMTTGRAAALCGENFLLKSNHPLMNDLNIGKGGVSDWRLYGPVIVVKIDATEDGDDLVGLSDDECKEAARWLENHDIGKRTMWGTL